MSITIIFIARSAFFGVYFIFSRARAVGDQATAKHSEEISPRVIHVDILRMCKCFSQSKSNIKKLDTKSALMPGWLSELGRAQMPVGRGFETARRVR
jgi:hypothetical protein